MNRSKRIGSALIVVGGSIAASPSMALELGDITVHSGLGQPLRASIAYALAPNEAIMDTCVSLLPVQAGGAPTIGNSSVRVADGRITISNGPVIREPLVSFRLNIRCHYTSRLTRDYTLFIDPPGRSYPAADAPRMAGNASVTAPVSNSAPARRVVSREPIPAESRYLVQSGDSLSLIAQRAATGQVSWRDLSDAIFRANPDAFVGDDPDRLKAGSWLDIPGVDGTLVAADSGQPKVAASTREAGATPAPAITGTVYAPENLPVPDGVGQAEFELLDEIPPPFALQPRNELRPGDLIFEPTATAPAVTVDAEDAAATATDTITIIKQPATRAPQGTNWLLWLAGGAAFLLGLVLIGRRFFGRFGSAPAPLAPALDAEDETQLTEALGDVDIDFGEGSLIPDDSPTAENPQLDADLFAGTGLSETDDVDLATDFSFAVTSDVDFELTEAMSADDEQPETDIIPPIHADASSILEGEILPEDEDYDISVVLDATKMPDPADVTERDLEAIAIGDGDDDETLISNDYTLSQEVDYKILEQDYQDEATAAEALNAELKKAAEDIAESLGKADATLTRNDTEAHTTVQDLDITAQMPANDDSSIDDDDDTGLNPAIRTNIAGDS